MSKFLNRFSPFDLIIISLLSACGIAIKPFVRLLTQMAVGTFIPAGTVAGIIYMIWIVLACAIVKKRGTAILVGIVQSVLVVVFDMLGNRGISEVHKERLCSADELLAIVSDVEWNDLEGVPQYRFDDIEGVVNEIKRYIENYGKD